MARLPTGLLTGRQAFSGPPPEALSVVRARVVTTTGEIT
ncbi:hypothetical protein BN2537_4523 [Streptomyces venezuelae]|nr:hypothetical protein BN2537_4523 [Streptomyces venezuelae]